MGKLIGVLFLFLGLLIFSCNSSTNCPDYEGMKCEFEEGSCNCKDFYDNGNIKRQYRVTQGKKNGIYYCYWPNGNVFQQGFYYNDVIFDTVKTYYKDGNLDWIGQYLLLNDSSHLNSFIEYNNGDTTSKSYFIQIKKLNIKPLQVGDTVFYKIKLFNPHFDRTGFRFGNYDKNFKLVDSTEYHLDEGRNSQIVYGVVCNKIGWNWRSVIVEDFKFVNGGTLTYPTYARFLFYVYPKEN